MTNYKITITGTVQGVGFRPFVYKIANELQLLGEVSNDSMGVTILLMASDKELDTFLNALQTKTPPLATIDDIKVTKTKRQDFENFKIVESSNFNLTTTLIPPDISICEDCQRELFDENDRRFGYAFITCTNCGVRYSIIKNLPYDRKNTSMDKFKMCRECQKEYENPNDRRYHAQPIGCFECGPKLEVRGKSEEVRIDGGEIDEIVKALKEGKIVAVKGVGGYHLMCDATNEEAVMKLRERKNRPSKPFAIMVKDIDQAKKLAHINQKEEELLTSQKRPIVILKILTSYFLPLTSKVAPNISKIGLFLPYTPLHLLVLEKFNRPLVATSANITDEPIATNLASMQKLSNVYDLILDHDREIVNGCDDSVVMVVEGQMIMLRRARGYAPSAIKLPFKLDKKVLALGANQKSTIAIGFDDNVILSPHIGDLDTIESVEYFEKNIEILKRVYNFEPDVVVHDKHPNYESTKYAQKFLTITSYLLLHQVQHHYAHILSVMAEKKIQGRVLGVAFDGTGFGDDGTLWGGEFLLCDYSGFERVAHLKPFKLLGGVKAIKEPKRVALSLLFELYGKDAIDLINPTTKSFSKSELKNFYLTWQKGLNAPLTSSMGRLFDAVASLTGVCQVMSFEGESGMLLEELYDESVRESYQVIINDKEIDFLPMIETMLQDEPKVAISKFFNTIVEIIIAISSKFDMPIVLGGGVFQNSVLLKLIFQKIPDVIISNSLPPNDGGIAFGQVVGSL